MAEVGCFDATKELFATRGIEPEFSTSFCPMLKIATCTRSCALVARDLRHVAVTPPGAALGSRRAELLHSGRNTSDKASATHSEEAIGDCVRATLMRNGEHGL